MHPFFQDYSFYGFVHRGGDEVETENTLEAFQYSSELGFVFIETDVQATKDGHVVIFHDYNLKRMAGLNSKIGDLTLAQVKSIELLEGGKIPLLSEALESFPELRFNIDIKTEDALSGTVQIIKDMECLEKVCLASFSSSRLERIRKLAGQKACTSSGQMEIFKLMCQSIGFPLKTTAGHCAQVPVSQWGVPVITKNFIQTAQKESKLVHVWTIDDEEQMYKLIDLGVDGLMTDKPTVLKRALTKRGLF
jgi:glycerophosphoryl diester phosphodiesterase